MTKLKKAAAWLILVLILASLSAKCFALFKRYQLDNIIRSNQLVIDQESHSWDLSDTKNPALALDAYLRNASSQDIDAQFIFEVALSTHGLEKSYLDAFTSVFAEGNTLGTMCADASDPKAIATCAYFKRGRKLRPHFDYEPMNGADIPTYRITFQKAVHIQSGELLKITHSQPFPPGKTGLIASIRLIEAK